MALTSCSKVHHLANVENTNYQLEESVHPEVDSAVLHVIAPYKQTLEKTMGEEIGIARDTLYRTHPDGSLNRWVADVMHKGAEEHSDRPIDFAVQNFYGLRIERIPQGPISLGLIYELMPFENYLVMQDIPGTVVEELCNLIAGYGGWPVSKGLSFVISDGVADSIIVKGEPLNVDKIYRIATNDYVANGGDHCVFLTPFEAINTGVLVRELLVEHIESQTRMGNSIGEKDGEARIIVR